MTRIEIAVEVGAIDAPTVQRLKDAGFDVYQGGDSWRVIAHEDTDPSIPVNDQAMNLASDILIDFRLDPLHSPPTVTLRYEDGAMEKALGDLVLEDARRASDPDPLVVMERRWWRKSRDPRPPELRDG
jgi:hypothetical protein